MKTGVKHLTSRANPFFKELLKISSDSRHRKKTARTLLDGTHLLEAYLVSGFKPLHLMVTETALQNDEISELLTTIPDVPITQLDYGLFGELSELKTPSGILALIEPPITWLSLTDIDFCLLLENIQDPGNLGSILRSAGAAGCDAVLLSSGCADVWSPRVLRAAMGGHFSMNLHSKQVMSIHEDVDLSSVAAEFQGKLLAASPTANISLFDIDLNGKLAFLLGNEGFGLSEKLMAASSQSFRIPMLGKLESLNVAAAAAVCLFETVRQQLNDKSV